MGYCVDNWQLEPEAFQRQRFPIKPENGFILSQLENRERHIVSSRHTLKKEYVQ